MIVIVIIHLPYRCLDSVTDSSGDNKGTILVIPMVKLSLNAFGAAKEKITRKKGTGYGDSNGPFRDTLRIRQLEADGWIVYSVSQMPSSSTDYFSDKHIEAALIQTTSKSRSFIEILQKRVKITQKPFFDVVSLDYKISGLTSWLNY